MMVLALGVVLAATRAGFSRVDSMGFFLSRFSASRCWTVLHRRSDWTTLEHPQMDIGRSLFFGELLRGGDAPFEQSFLLVRRRGREGALRVQKSAAAISAPPMKLAERRVP